ncbi:hypothetical protein FRB95_006712 [Tulasnella sp. JGI-2019a]|nr:hypothetical protein FRB95_006712 [Tulasnella sp. JGI-2019a]
MVTSCASKYDPTRDIPNLRGKVFLVSGGNAGIGYETVAELVRHGAKVYMGARSESRATTAIEKLKVDGYLNDGGEVIWHELDLMTPASVRRSAEAFMKREARLDVLVNNAGMAHWAPDSFTAVDTDVPICRLMSANHLGPFALTTTLLPLIKRTAAEPNSDVRIVTVSSNAHTSAKKVDWKTTDGWNFQSTGFVSDLQSYGTTKLANILFAKELQRVLDRDGVDATSISLHPGGVNTGAVQNMRQLGGLGYALYYATKFSGQLLTPAEGASASLFAATSLEVSADKRKYAGAYLMPFGRLVEPSKDAKDEIAARDLWETSERAVLAI